MKFEVTIDGNTRELMLDIERQQVTLDGQDRDYRFTRQENGRYLLRIGTILYKIDNVEYDKPTVSFTIDGNWCKTEVYDEQDLLLDKLGFKTAADLGEGQLKAPMPGKILEILIEEDSPVELGDPVAILEAMKMENELKAPISGTVTSIVASEGESVDKNALILEIEASG